MLLHLLGVSRHCFHVIYSPTKTSDRHDGVSCTSSQLAKDAMSDGALDWPERLDERVAFNSQQVSDEIEPYPFCAKNAPWLSLTTFTQFFKLKMPLNSCSCMFRNMVEAARAEITAERQRHMAVIFQQVTQSLFSVLFFYVLFGYLGGLFGAVFFI